RSVSRDSSGAWGAVVDVYTARTNGALSDPLEVGYVRPRLVPGGTGVTVAWADYEGANASQIPVADRPFNARRWLAGEWGPAMTSEGYGAEGMSTGPVIGADVRIYADPVQAARASDGRISYVYTLLKI